MDALGSPLGYIILAVLLLLSAIFSGSETALFAVNRLRMRRMAEEGRRRPALVLRLLEQPGRVLTALLVGNNIANVTASVLATAILVAVLGPQRGPVYAIIIMTLLILIIGEITPKTFAAKYADALAILVSRPVHYFTIALTPVIWLLSRVSDLLVRPLGGRVNPASPLVTEEEIRLLVQMGQDVGAIKEDERAMIHSIFEFGDTVAREVMVPRIDMVSVPDAANLDEILRVILEEGHSRLPVYHESIDRIVGVIYIKDLLSHLKADHSTMKAREVMRPAYFIPETKRLDDLFREMRRKKTPMAIVVDEYGGTAGLVTTEDLLEEIVGPILDEYDVEEKLVEVVNDQVAVVDGRMSVEEVNELLHLDLPVGEVDTIGGFVYSLLGRAPTQGESISADGVDMQVERLDGQRIARVKITKRVPSQSVRQ